MVIDLGVGQMIAAYLFVLLVLWMVRWRGIPREKDIAISSLRMTLQLVLVGYMLAYIFEQQNPWFTLVIIVAMEAFAVHTIWSRSRHPLSQSLRMVVLLALVTGTLSSLLYFLLVVVRLSPWWEPRYFIPIAGMLIGNSMTGIALGINHMLEGMHSRRHLVEGALMLGARPQLAVKSVVDGAFDAAILPTINSMLGMGIVFLPGMMTGQILSGTSPFTAIEYQIAIMLGILGAVAITVMLFLQLGYRTFFNHRLQLLEEEWAEQ